MTTLEPLSEAELNELQARWMEGHSPDNTYRCVWLSQSDDVPKSEFRAYSSDPLAEDWTKQPPFPDDWTRHTVDINCNPMSVEDEPIAYVKPWKWLAALAVVAVFYVAVWVLVVWVARR